MKLRILVFLSLFFSCFSVFATCYPSSVSNINIDGSINKFCPPINTYPYKDSYGGCGWYEDSNNHWCAGLPECTSPEVWDEVTQQCTSTPPKNNGNPGCPNACEGNPINTATGNKFQTETDFVLSPDIGLEFHRYYNSQDFNSTGFGIGWRSTWQQSIVNTSNSNVVKAVRADGRVDTFTKNTSGVWQADPDVTSRLTDVVNSANLQTGWKLTTPEDNVELYTLEGRLTSITNRAGQITKLEYNASNQLSIVTGYLGHVISFGYIGNNRISTITLPDNTVYNYSYSNNNTRLDSVAYPDTAIRKYVYENTEFPYALTGIVDESGKRFATFSYDALGKAVSTEHAGGVEKINVVYNQNGNSTITDALNNNHSYNFISQFGVIKPTATTNTSGGKSFGYDSNGFLSSKTDSNNNITTFVHDTRGLETSRTEASGTTIARTVSTTWHPVFRLPVTITESNRVTTFTYDSKGNLIQRTITPTIGLAQTWTYTYNARGQVTSIDEPRTDTIDVTTFVYYPNNFAVVNNRKLLKTITNALGHVTSFTSYNANGQPLRILDANGLVTLLSYDTRGRLLTRNVGGEITSYSYDNIGQVLQITFPDTHFISYLYDDAHRLIQEVDSLGNKTVYTLDAMGNRLKIQNYNPDGSLAQTRSQEFDELNRLKKSIGAQNQITQYSYDSNDNLISVTDALSQTSSSGYDALNRLTSSTNPLFQTTQYQYDANDNLNKVKDPRSVVTQYVYDGLGNQLQTLSPDTGTTTKTFDAAGNVLTSTDARGLTTTYSYDALNRVTQISFSSGTPITFTYDTGTNGIGRLATMTDEAGITTWTYDGFGRVTSKSQKVGTLIQTISYAYNVRGQLETVVYPSGNSVKTSYNTAGQTQQITLNDNPVVSNIRYTPLGEVQSWLFGNNQTYQRGFDLDGRLIQYPLGGSLRNLNYDVTDRVTDYSHTNTLLNQHFAYNAANQLTVFSKNSALLNYAYDNNGNRLKKTTQTTSTLVTDYGYDTASNRLLNTTTTGSPMLNVSYDMAGNILNDGNTAYGYNARGRLVQVTTAAGITRYAINGLGQRVRKATPTVVRRFMYDEAGHLLGEYTNAGVPNQETLYLGDKPVAVTKGATVSYVYADHLNTPRVITDTTGKNIWQWNADPFGVTLADSDPDGDGVPFNYNLRFPGQYYDGETGLHYNYFRDYNPSTGRYIESDPIGLRGGVNTFGYVGGNPVNLVDPLGLKPVPCPKGLPSGATCDDGKDNDKVPPKCTSIDCLIYPPETNSSCTLECIKNLTGNGKGFVVGAACAKTVGLAFPLSIAPSIGCQTAIKMYCGQKCSEKPKPPSCETKK
jgi:RHS repeat-associated protein